MQIRVMPGLTVEYVEEFYPPAQVDNLLRAFLAVEMTPEVMRIYGHDILTKRRSEQYGMDYLYNPAAKKSRECDSTDAFHPAADRVRCRTARRWIGADVSEW